MSVKLAAIPAAENEPHFTLTISASKHPFQMKF